MATIADLTGDILTHTGTSRLTLLQTVMENFVNEAIRRMERKHHFRGQEVTLDPLPYPANADFVPVPTDFVTERGVWQKMSSQTDPSKALSSFDKTLRRFWIEAKNPTLLRDTLFPNTASPTVTSPTQQFYYIWNRGLFLIPTPTTAPLSLVLDYIRIVPDLTGTQSNWFTEFTPDVVRAGAMAEAFRFLQVPEAATLWEAAFQDRLQEAIRQDESLSLSGPPSSRGRGDN